MRKRYATPAPIAERGNPDEPPLFQAISQPTLERLAVTVDEGARLLGVGRATLYKLVMRGEVESFTVGRARRIAISALEQYMRMARSA